MKFFHTKSRPYAHGHGLILNLLLIDNIEREKGTPVFLDCKAFNLQYTVSEVLPETINSYNI